MLYVVHVFSNHCRLMLASAIFCHMVDVRKCKDASVTYKWFFFFFFPLGHFVLVLFALQLLIFVLFLLDVLRGSTLEM